MGYFTIQLPLKTTSWQIDKLNKRFEIARQMYNTLLKISSKRYFEMIKTKKYRNLKTIVNPITIKMRNKMLEEYGINLNALIKDVEKIQQHYQTNIDLDTAHDIAMRLWQAYQKVLKLRNVPPQYKKYGSLNSLRSKNNNDGIHFTNDCLIWNGLIIKAKIKANDIYLQQSLKHKIAFCRLVRKYIQGKYHYYVQIVLIGSPPPKINYQSGEFKHKIGNGDVGIDIGVNTIAIVASNCVKLLDLSEMNEYYETKLNKLQRKMQRSRRQTNPNNYQENGMPKEGRLTWVKSNHYLKYEDEMREIYRKYHDTLKYYHDMIANYIISLGDNIYVEAMDFEELKRNYQIINNRKLKKHNFGKAIYLNAPSQLLLTLERKLSYYGLKLHKIDTKKARASQFNHLTNTYKKKPLTQRWNDLDGIMVHRDLYSAFLIMNINSDLETFDLAKCNARYENFLILHNREIANL